MERKVKYDLAFKLKCVKLVGYCTAAGHAQIINIMMILKREHSESQYPKNKKASKRMGFNVHATTCKKWEK